MTQCRLRPEEEGSITGEEMLIYHEGQGGVGFDEADEMKEGSVSRVEWIGWILFKSEKAISCQLYTHHGHSNIMKTT